jgi:predicted enzyme related to lactoylglutathione lyase
MAVQYVMHLGICVRDLERDGVRIELLQYPSPGTVGNAERRPMNQPGLTHLALRVDDLDETITKLTPLGGTILEHTRIYDEKFDSHIVYITDPDGTRLEVIQVPNDPTR